MYLEDFNQFLNIKNNFLILVLRIQLQKNKNNYNIKNEKVDQPIENNNKKKIKKIRKYKITQKKNQIILKEEMFLYGWNYLKYI